MKQPNSERLIARSKKTVSSHRSSEPTTRAEPINPNVRVEINGVDAATRNAIESAIVRALQDITPESVMLAIAGVSHSIRNTGTGPLKFVFVYSPPLPEHISREEYFKRAKDKLPSEHSG